MKQEWMTVLQGLGYTRLSARQRRLLRLTLLVSLGLHIVGLIAFGSWVIMQAQTEEKTVFVAPPPLKTYEPRQLEHKVKVSTQQRSSSRPTMLPRLVATKTTSNLKLPQLKLDPKLIHTSFQPKFRAVAGGTGMGVGVGTGYGVGGFGTGVTQFNFFGIRGQADRIAILIDVSISMIEEDRGGAAGFLRVKDRISQVLDEMNEAAMFNLVVFADAAMRWQDKLLIASQENKEAAKRWLRPFNTEGNLGLTSGNVAARSTGVEAVGGTTRLDLALTAAFDLGADTILIISDGLPRVEKPVDAKAAEEYQKRLADWQKKNEDKIRAWEGAPEVEQRVWVPASDGKLREGQAARAASKGEWVVRKVRQGQRPEGPKPPDRSYWTLNDFITHFDKLNEHFYAKKGMKPPVVHTIGYQIDPAGGSFLRQLSEHYKGHYRRVARLR